MSKTESKPLNNLEKTLMYTSLFVGSAGGITAVASAFYESSPMIYAATSMWFGGLTSITGSVISYELRGNSQNE